MTSGTQLQPLDDQIAITGMGVVSPIGQGIEAFWAGLVNGVGVGWHVNFTTNSSWTSSSASGLPAVAKERAGI